MRPRAILHRLLFSALAPASLACGVTYGLVCGVAACGVPFTTESTGGGGASTATTSSTGMTGTTSGTAGGGPCTADSCLDGQYCNINSGACVSCDDMSRLQFADPKPVGLMLGGQSISALYPRVVEGTFDLWLTELDQNTHLQIAVAPANAGKDGWGAAGLFPGLNGVNNDAGGLYLKDSGKLAGLVPDQLANAHVPVLLFHSNRTAGMIQVFAFPLDGSTVSNPPSLNLPGGGALVSEIAVADAISPPRFFWVTNAGPSALRLVTSADPTSFEDVKIKLDDDCDAPLAREPWVMPSGTLLFFASVPTGANCVVPSGSKQTRIYVVELEDGKQKTKTRRIFPNDSSSFDSTPALAPDRCSLFFSRHDGTGKGIVYRARRE